MQEVDILITEEGATVRNIFHLLFNFNIFNKMYILSKIQEEDMVITTIITIVDITEVNINFKGLPNVHANKYLVNLKEDITAKKKLLVLSLTKSAGSH